MDTRDQLIDTAVKFLQNAKVANSPLAKRKEFLKQKGLTDEEVSIAVSKAGIANDTQLLPTGPQPPPPPVVYGGNGVVAAWRWRGVVGLAMLIAAATFGLYKLIREQVIPWLRGAASREEELASSVRELRDGVDSLQRALREQGDGITRLLARSSSHDHNNPVLAAAQENQQFTQLKSEIVSLKGLLLSRNVFPPVPKAAVVSGSGPAASLPAWQLAVCSDDDKSKGEPTTSHEAALAVAATDDSNTSLQGNGDDSHTSPQCNSDDGRTTPQCNGDDMIHCEESRDNVPVAAAHQGELASPHGSGEGKHNPTTGNEDCMERLSS